MTFNIEQIIHERPFTPSELEWRPLEYKIKGFASKLVAGTLAAGLLTAASPAAIADDFVGPNKIEETKTAQIEIKKNIGSYTGPQFNSERNDVEREITFGETCKLPAEFDSSDNCKTLGYLLALETSDGKPYFSLDQLGEFKRLGGTLEEAFQFANLIYAGPSYFMKKKVMVQEATKIKQVKENAWHTVTYVEHEGRWAKVIPLGPQSTTKGKGVWLSFIDDDGKNQIMYKELKSRKEKYVDEKGKHYHGSPYAKLADNVFRIVPVVYAFQSGEEILTAKRKGITIEDVIAIRDEEDVNKDKKLDSKAYADLHNFFEDELAKHIPNGYIPNIIDAHPLLAFIRRHEVRLTQDYAKGDHSAPSLTGHDQTTTGYNQIGLGIGLSFSILDDIPHYRKIAVAAYLHLRKERKHIKDKYENKGNGVICNPDNQPLICDASISECNDRHDDSCRYATEREAEVFSRDIIF